jgi:phage protein U
MVMMQLGSFQFGINTAAYQELDRVTSFRWASHEVFGKIPARQFTGEGEDQITLSGVILPEWRGGTQRVEQLRALGNQGQPLQLISGTGKLMGKWVIEQVSEKQNMFFEAGVPRKQEFTLRMSKHE